MRLLFHGNAMLPLPWLCLGPITHSYVYVHIFQKFGKQLLYECWHFGFNVNGKKRVDCVVN